MKKLSIILLVLLLCLSSLTVTADSFSFAASTETQEAEPTEAPHEPDEEYQAGLKYMKEKKYFSAYMAFGDSSEDDAEKKQQSCIQKWPKTSEVWRKKGLKKCRMQLTIKVNQDSDRAFYAKIYRGDTEVSNIFIGGTGKVKVKLPGGTYRIKDGTGELWFGTKESFGEFGSYETMIFDDAGKDTVKLKDGYGYTITVNVQEGDPEGKGIGSEYESCEGFNGK